MFPSLWNTFGLTEDAAAIFLVGVGLLAMFKGGKTRVFSQGWGDICANFKTNYLELSMKRWNEIRLYLARLGNCCFSPSQIWNKKLKSPAKLISHIQSKFVVLQLATMLNKSGKLEVILDLPYCDDAFLILLQKEKLTTMRRPWTKKLPIFQMIVNVLILKLRMGWEQMKINSLCLTILGFQWKISRLSSSYTNN